MAGMSSGGGDDYTPMAEMNMVPFIDVMLVLLIISMVTTPFLEQGVTVELPVAGGKSLQKQVTETPVILYVSKDKKLKIDSQSVSRSNLAMALAKKFKGRESKELFVRADKAVPYGVVAEIMSEVQSAGIERVGLVTQPQ